MADFVTKGTVDGSPTVTQTFAVVAGGVATIAIGDIVVAANGYAAKVADGGAATAGLYGKAITASDETASANGTVVVEYSPAGLIVEGDATTPSNIATAILFDLVTLDVDGSGNQTLDENDAGNGILRVWSFESDATTTGRIQFVVPFNISG